MINSEYKDDPMFNREINDEQINTQPPSESNDGVFGNLNPAEIPTETREYKYERSKKEVKQSDNKSKKKFEFSKIVLVLVLLLNFAVVGCAIAHMMMTGDGSVLGYIGVADGAGLGAASAFYSKKAMQENKRKIGKGILDDMEGKYTFDETVRLLEIICRD